MLKRLAPALVLLLAASVAYAQMGPGGGMGGQGGGGGHRGGGRGGGGRGGGQGGGSSAPTPPRKPPVPVDQIQIIGVVKAIDAASERLTIAYEPVEALNWPAGTQPFPVAKTAMMSLATVGQRVRFSLDSGHISALAPIDAPKDPQ